MFPQIRFVGPGVARLLQAVDAAGQPLQVATVGLPAFRDGRRPQDVCRHRPRSEFLPFLLPYLAIAPEPAAPSRGPAGRLVVLRREALLRLLEAGRLDAAECPPTLVGLEPGVCILVLNESCQAQEKLEAVVAWKGRHGAVRLHADDASAKFMLQALTGKQ